MTTWLLLASAQARTASGTGHPWRHNVVVRDWPYACHEAGLRPFDPVGRTVPPRRQVHGFDLLEDSETCGDGHATEVGPMEGLPGVPSPRQALSTWNAGVVEVHWCLEEGDTLVASGPAAFSAHLDEAIPSEWTIIPWRHSRDRLIHDCPWRRVLRVPIVLELTTADGGVSGTLTAWLLVNSDEPGTWALSERAPSMVRVGDALVEAWRSRSGEAEGVPGGRLFTSVSPYWGHRQLTLWVGVPEDMWRLEGEWRWSAR
ncbi:MAG: hypothetical protein H6738_02995 [Alphaproteobacteria bacterium]|nr:hypothetical protein [Alphaproteobacteria bacterium]MCB9695736.1 hypothetical protein [Alphaproteobacteria bacterium]